MSTPSGARVACVAAVARNGVIGDGPDIPWRIPGEQADFKRITLGHTLLMGRTTYESIGRPLPGRTTIVLTRDIDWDPGHPDVLVAHDLDAAVRLADTLHGSGAGDLMVVGGAQVYAAALAVPGLVDEQIITEVPLEPAGDVRYPAYDGWTETRREPRDGYTIVHRRRNG